MSELIKWYTLNTGSQLYVNYTSVKLKKKLTRAGYGKKWILCDEILETQPKIIICCFFFFFFPSCLSYSFVQALPSLLSREHFV